MLIRVAVFAVWSLVGLTAMFWGLRLFTQAAGLPAHAVVVAGSSAAQGDLQRLLGAPAPTAMATAVLMPEASTRYRLAGVMAPRAKADSGVKVTQAGLALISIDGRPARAYRIGARVGPEWVLKSVGQRTATLAAAQGDASLMIEAPAWPTPAGAAPPPQSVDGPGLPRSRAVPMPVPMPIPEQEPAPSDAPEMPPPPGSSPGEQSGR